jgi:hypothetical protein
MHAFKIGAAIVLALAGLAMVPAAQATPIVGCMPVGSSTFLSPVGVYILIDESCLPVDVDPASPAFRLAENTVNHFTGHPLQDVNINWPCFDLEC